ncbi:hypothetical protein IZ6_25430 [Terrihabitans soli]|uniref:Uncharacterized protein n=1 Tax=Terrihabitans soli TaxID=708113 RepID=A0A6S6QYX5_9HYPH|nr:hypothetical protein [Terrihabitans soli]BCJ91808.1 hypothetical protein IZ6_25430 [Terrihabitans soli]
MREALLTFVVFGPALALVFAAARRLSHRYKRKAPVEMETITIRTLGYTDGNFSYHSDRPISIQITRPKLAR